MTLADSGANSVGDTAHRVAVAVVGDGDANGVRQRFPHALIVGTLESEDADLLIPATSERQPLKRLLEHAASQWRRSHKVHELVREVGVRRRRMHQVSSLGIQITTHTDLDLMLETLLREARGIANCEGGSLYLLETDADDESWLCFKLAQNDCVATAFAETRLPLTKESIAGYVALSGTEVMLADVYDIPDSAPYGFNRSFDEKMGYRTRSMLVLPMNDHRGNVVGVLQFINRADAETGRPMQFDDDVAEVLRAIASQAAVSVQKNSLINDVNQLFESFVRASVKTIESRDPGTSGHSFRVAEKTVALLEALPSSNVARFSSVQLSPEHIREVRYAALLHDFGKVSVRETVLEKANKLTDERLESIQFRLELQKERLRRRAVERQLELLHQEGSDLEVAFRRVQRDLRKQIAKLDEYFDWISRANRPNILDDGDFAHLAEIRDYHFREVDGTLDGLITDTDMLALSVRRGSLTPQERREIQAHVVHTRDFLNELPWPPELRNVPSIAGAHHEKLDGSGYPDGLMGEQIPLASRVMTVCDIYDALTAMDRPYKQAMSAERALDILYLEAGEGLLEKDLIDIFVESRVYTLGSDSLGYGVRRAG